MFKSIKLISSCLIMGFMASILFFSQALANKNPESNYIICYGQYALCAAAKCMPDPTNPAARTICQCQVFDGPNLGLSTCKARAPKEVNQATLIKSTFSFKDKKGRNFMKCPAGTLWSNCLDANCTVNPTNSNKAICSCKLVKKKAVYTFGGNCDTKTCDKSYWSGATLAGAKGNFSALTKYLKKNNVTVDSHLCKKQ